MTYTELRKDMMDAAEKLNRTRQEMLEAARELNAPIAALIAEADRMLRGEMDETQAGGTTRKFRYTKPDANILAPSEGAIIGRTETPPEGAKKPRVRFCGTCGKPGHDGRNCPEKSKNA